ncbi:MAG TPA: hypothetical protein VFQ39_03190 [Longimicrobium sp.]|nr:hypothetical protein [Longimicrobium sp.]
MILHCNFEELRALESASEMILSGMGAPVGVAAPPESVGLVEQLLTRLGGDMSIETLDEQRRVQQAVTYICSDLHRRLDDKIIETTNPANEEAVALYFDYGHSRTVLHRLSEMGAEMEAIVELIGGGNAAGVTFPD